MQLLQASISLSLLLLASSAMASPTKHGDCKDGHNPKIPKITQENECSGGTRLCCDAKNGANNCYKSDVKCDDTVVCCNNDVGHQFCVGEIDFNQPITISVKKHEETNIKDNNINSNNNNHNKHYETNTKDSNNNNNNNNHNKHYKETNTKDSNNNNNNNNHNKHKETNINKGKIVRVGF